MSTTLPKWTDERTEQLTTYVGAETPVSIETVASAADTLDTTTRSVAAKLRKMGYEVEKVGTTVTKTFTEEEEDTLRAFLESNAGEYTYSDIAGIFADGKYSPRAIQGKVLSMELTSFVKPAPVKSYQRTYTAEEEAMFVEMANDGAFLEDIATRLGKPINSVRGKALSLSRSGEISGIPAKRDVKPRQVDAFADIDVSALTVAEIAEQTEKTERGVRTMLTRRGLDCVDYAGSTKAEKAKAKAAA